MPAFLEFIFVSFISCHAGSSLKNVTFSDDTLPKRTQKCSKALSFYNNTI